MFTLYSRGRRHVFVLGNLVFKFPSLRFRWSLKMCWRYLTDLWVEGLPSGKRFYWMMWEIQDFLFKGIKENFREAKAILRPYNPRLPRIYLPLVVLNVYRREDGVGKKSFRKFEAMTFHDKMHELGEGPLWEILEENGLDMHEFSTRNFSFNGENVVFLDYGGKNYLEMIELYGDRIEKVLFAFLTQKHQKQLASANWPGKPD